MDSKDLAGFSNLSGLRPGSYFLQYLKQETGNMGENIPISTAIPSHFFKSWQMFGQVLANFGSTKRRYIFIELESDLLFNLLRHLFTQQSQHGRLRNNHQTIEPVGIAGLFQIADDLMDKLNGFVFFGVGGRIVRMAGAPGTRVPARQVLSDFSVVQSAFCVSQVCQFLQRRRGALGYKDAGASGVGDNNPD